jgi:hypothetical protein
MTVTPGAYPIFDPGGINAQKTVNRARVMMSESMHDTAIITLRNEPLDVPELQPGTPVVMQYGWHPVDVDTFYGYIDHVENHYDRALSSGVTYEDVVCMGVSYALKDPYVGSWINVKASTLVRQVAQKYFLSTVVEDEDALWPSIVSPGDTAWCFLTQLANKVGYSLACNKSQIRFTSADLGLRRYWSGMPVFQSRNAAVTYLEQSISRFTALQGEALPIAGHQKAIRSVTGLNPQGQIVGAVDDGSSLPSQLGYSSIYPFFGQQISDQVVTSQAHAQAVLTGMTQANRFNYQATATLSGLTSVRQGMPILLQGIDKNQDGMWWVQEVTHKILSEGYSMDVCIGRDSLGDSGQRPVQGTAVAYTPQNPFSYSIINAPVTQMIGKRWRAATVSNVDVS